MPLALVKHTAFEENKLQLNKIYQLNYLVNNHTRFAFIKKDILILYPVYAGCGTRPYPDAGGENGGIVFANILPR